MKLMPKTACDIWQLGHSWIAAIPCTGMMGTAVTKDGETAHPTFKIGVLWQTNALCHLFLHLHIFHIGIQLGEVAERNYFQCLPYRRPSSVSKIFQ